jgi:hypothetical protein
MNNEEFKNDAIFDILVAIKGSLLNLSLAFIKSW